MRIGDSMDKYVKNAELIDLDLKYELEKDLEQQRFGNFVYEQVQIRGCGYHLFDSTGPLQHNKWNKTLHKSIEGPNKENFKSRWSHSFISKKIIIKFI